MNRILKQFGKESPLVIALLALINIAGCSLFFANFRLLTPHIPPRRPGLPTVREIERQWTRQLLDMQSVTGGGGFSGTQSGPLSIDVWTTAQALNGILRGPDHAGVDHQVRKAFEFIESMHQEATDSGPGWVTFPRSTRARTEISAWVVLAYIASARAGDVWSKSETASVADRVSVLLKEIVSRQNPSTFGWGPIAASGPDSDRTYATTMALWSLVEASQAAPFSQQAKQYNLNIRRGISALMRIPHVGGWCAAQSTNETHPGLTAEVLYVLSLAAADPELFNAIDLEEFKRARQSFVNTFSPVSISYSAKDRPSVWDERIDSPSGKEIDEPFYVTFLPFPWSIALLGQIVQDHTLPQGIRTQASDLLVPLVDQLRSQGALKYFQSVETYVVAESLIGIECLPNK
jgi:hypothetical protein